MKKILVTLIASILIFVTTLLVMNNYVRHQTIQEADEDVAYMLDAFCTELDQNLVMTQNAAYGFLTGTFSMQASGKSGSIFVERSDRQFFQEDILKRLSVFLKVNPSYHDAMFIIQTDFGQPLTQSSFYAPMLIQGEDTIVDVSRFYDFSVAENYNRCKNTLKAHWTIPSQKSSMAQKLITYYVPLCRHTDGVMIGVFSVSLNVNIVDKKLEKHLPYGKEDSEMTLATNDGLIISSYPTFYRDFISYDQLEKQLRRQGRSYCKDTVDGRSVINYNGEVYYKYQRYLQKAPWHVVTVCKDTAIYASAYRTSHVVLITSLLGMLLMLIACVIISYQVRRSHIARVSAENELAMAAKVQAKMLRKPDFSTRHATINAFIQPAREAGGDLYDYAALGEKLIICIGDVSGKGMPAALFMTQVVSLFRSAICRTTSPAEIVASINDVLAHANPDMTFCTLFVAVIDADTITFCNAGHNNPVILHSDLTQSIGFLSQKPNIAIGLMQGYPYRNEQCRLTSGDTLLLYTDGVTEAKNLARKMFGEHALLKTLAGRPTNNPKDVTNILVGALTAFVGTAEQSDDITILAVGR